MFFLFILTAFGAPSKVLQLDPLQALSVRLVDGSIINMQKTMQDVIVSGLLHKENIHLVMEENVIHASAYRVEGAAHVPQGTKVSLSITECSFSVNHGRMYGFSALCHTPYNDPSGVQEDDFQEKIVLLLFH